jgi:predicted transcriptional regulator
MKLTSRDKEIIRIIQESSAGLKESHIRAILGVKKENRSMLNKRLIKLYRNGIVNRVRSSITIYYIDKIHDVRRLDLVKVKCRRCGLIENVLREQDTRVCKRCKHRYWVTREREVVPNNDIPS